MLEKYVRFFQDQCITEPTFFDTFWPWTSAPIRTWHRNIRVFYLETRWTLHPTWRAQRDTAVLTGRLTNTSACTISTDKRLVHLMNFALNFTCFQKQRKLCLHKMIEETGTKEAKYMVTQDRGNKGKKCQFILYYIALGLFF